MTDEEKPRGDLKDAEGVTADSDGSLHLEMEVLQKGGNDGEAEAVSRKTETDDE